MILSDRSNSRRDERLSRSPLGRPIKLFLASFSRISAGISSNVSRWRVSVERPQFAHSKRVVLLNNDDYSIQTNLFDSYNKAVK